MEQQRTYRCCKCEQRKPIEKFYQKLHARQSYCIECCSIIKKEKRNPDDWFYLFCGEGEWMKCYLL